MLYSYIFMHGYLIYYLSDAFDLSKAISIQLCLLISSCEKWQELWATARVSCDSPVTIGEVGVSVGAVVGEEWMEQLWWIKLKIG